MIKNVKKISNEPKNATENQTWRIIMIDYHGIKFGGEAMKTPSIGVRFATSPLGTMILLLRCYGFQLAIIVACAKFYQNFSMVSRDHATMTHQFL